MLSFLRTTKPCASSVLQFLIISDEGAINLSLAQNRGQDVRINGPVGPGSAVRMETGFPMQSSQGNHFCLFVLLVEKH